MGREDGIIVIGTELETKKLDKQISLLEDKLEGLEQEYDALEKAKPFDGQNEQLIKLGNEIDTTKRKIAKMRKEKEKIDGQGFANLSASISNVGNAMTGIIKKVAKWSLAVIGIRSVYLGIRSAMATLSQYDDGLKEKTEYLKWALANSIKPIIEWIMNALYKIVGFVGAIINSITGINIFEKSGVSDYEKALKNSNKSAKDIKKTIAGFDEMNVLNDDKTTGVASPINNTLKDWDLSKEIEKLTKKLKSLIKSFSLNKIKEVINNFINWLDEDFLGVLRKLFGPIGDLIYLPFEASIKAIRTLFENLIGGFKKIISGIVDLFKGNFAEGIAKIFSGLSDILLAPFRAMLTFVSTGINRVKEFLKGMADWIYSGVIKPISDWFSNLWENIKTGAKNGWEGVKSVWNGVATWFNNTLIQPIKNFFGGMWNGLINGAKNAWEGIKSVFSTVGNWFKNIFSNAWQGVVNVFSAGGRIFVSIKDAIVNAFKWIVNGLIDGINNVVAIPFNGINSAFDGLRSVDLWGWKPFEWVPRFNVPQIPHLAKGGILNNPGRGVYTGNAIAGESGREFYMPLQDEQMLSLVGEAIGKYVNINLTNITELDGRQIARKVEQINNNNRFVLNR